MDPTCDRDQNDNGLKYAQDLTFSQETYEEAMKLVDCPSDANDLLMALLEVSNRESNPVSRSSSLMANEKDSVSSCYSSFEQSHMTSSSDQSLESLSVSNQKQGSLRKIYIDGSNVARSHGKDDKFSWTGIRICIDWFLKRKHKTKVFIPVDKCDRAAHDSEAESVITYLNCQDALVKTPSGSNDDLYVIESAKHNEGVIVSNDLFRDEKRFNEEMSNYVNQNRLPYAFVDDLFLPAFDPLGRAGPSLDEFLRSTYTSFYLHNKLCKTRSQPKSLRNSNSLKYPRFAQPNGYRLTSTRYQSMPATRSSDSSQSAVDSRHIDPLITFEDQPRSLNNLQERHLRQQMQRVMTVGCTVQKSKTTDLKHKKRDYS